ncbi:PGPGW domain-containing protein [Egicoccus sp. AB-alg6-2]|uniref:PGPGW domain-containing protein n=1 Tax=Egicoccus sp. AB-alg6-2 TaxID=3242692 RepID=UPI00359E960E
MAVRLLKAGLGLLLVVAGIAMLVLPGPGLLAIAAGVALSLSQWPWGRRTLARLRVWSRERYGSARVRVVEARIPDEVCPPNETGELRELAELVQDPETPPPPPKPALTD